MTKIYHIEAKFGSQWILVKKIKLHVDALNYVKEQTTEDRNYPLRIVRIVRTVVLKEKE